MKTTKRCPQCSIEKSLDAFSKNKASRDGLQSCCKPCWQILVKTWRENNPERTKQHYEKYRNLHREKRREYNQQWRKQNGEYWRNYQNERLRIDINYRLRNYISRAIRRAIKKNRKSTISILDFSIAELRQHLEALFQVGMSWDNYGSEWHMDHVIPQSWFKLHTESGVDEYELKLCWSLGNLQPMWSLENLEKKDHHIYHIKTGRSLITYEQFRILIESHKREPSAFMLQASMASLEALNAAYRNSTQE